MTAAAAAPKPQAGITTSDKLRIRLREQTAVLAWFDDGWLNVPHTDDADLVVDDFLMSDCRRVPGPDGKQHWRRGPPAARHLRRGQRGAQAAAACTARS